MLQSKCTQYWPKKDDDCKRVFLGNQELVVRWVDGNDTDDYEMRQLELTQKIHGVFEKLDMTCYEVQITYMLHIMLHL